MSVDVKAETPNLDTEPTIGFICPLFRELAAVRAIFDEHLDTRQIYTDGDLESEYHYGRIGPRTAVAVSFADKKVGPSWAAAHATKLLDRHKSLTSDKGVYFLVGVAAGISRKEDVRLGDVVIATQVVDWTSGKVGSNNTFESTEHAQDVANTVRLRTARFCDNLIRLGERLRSQASRMRPEHEADQSLWQWPGPEEDVLFQSDVEHVGNTQDCQQCEQRIEEREPRDTDLPKVHRGLIAAGNVVLKDAETRDRIRKDLKDNVLAVEMEANGVMTASKKFVIIRGICDYGDSHKNKRWQHYAAVVAAACARIWIEDIVLTDNRKLYPVRTGTESLLEDDAPEDSAAKEDPDSGHFQKPVKSASAQSDRYSSRRFGASNASTEDDDSSVDMTQRDGEPSAATVHTDDDGDWTTLLDCEIADGDIHVRDGSVGKQASSTKHKDFRLRFEVQKDQQESSTNRRLRLVHSSSRPQANVDLWVPHSHVQVCRTAKRLTVDFSDCNQCVKCRHGRFNTRNGIALYRTGYDPVHPNVGLDLEFITESDASSLYELLMSRDRRLLAQENSSIQQYIHCRVFHKSANESEQQIATIYVWSKQRDHEISDLGSFSRRLDFDISLNNEFIDVYLGYMNKHVYEPVDRSTYSCSSGPPVKVKENYDGRPGSATYGGGGSLFSCLWFKTESNEVCRLLSGTVGSFVSWDMKAFAPDVKFVLVSNSRTTKNQELSSVQLTAWENNSDLRIFARAAEDHAHNKKCWWIACTLPRKPNMQITSDLEAAFELDNFREGNYISSETFLPRERSNRWRAVRLTFKVAADRALFERLFTCTTTEGNE